MGKIWQYVDHLWANNKQNESAKYIEAGLTFEPFNYFQQARLATIMAGKGERMQALARAEVIWQKSEDEETLKLISSVVKKELADSFQAPRKEDFASPTVVLVALGKINRILALELKERIACYLGMEVRIFESPFPLPPEKRSFFCN